MKLKPTYKSKSFCFSRWSRKAWAVFSGLHKVIKLGHLSAPVCELALIKSGRTDGNKIVLLNNKNCDSDTSDIGDPLLAILAQFLFLSQILISSSQKSECFAGKPVRFLFIANYFPFLKYFYNKFWAKAQFEIYFFCHGLKAVVIEFLALLRALAQIFFNFQNLYLFTYLLNPIFYGSTRNL